MKYISYEIQRSTVENLLAAELKKQRVKLADDPDLRYNILSNAADYILYESGVDKDIQLCVDKIKEYIKDTKMNYPSYFLTGNEN